LGSASYTVHSAETYVHEPGDLWTRCLPLELQPHAFRLVDKGEGRHAWVDAADHPIAPRGEGVRHKPESTTAGSLLEHLDREGITGAVLYPSIAHRAYARCHESKALDVFLETYNAWILDLVTGAPGRLRPVCLVNVDDPRAAAKEMAILTERGAAGFVIPMTPGHGHRYDMPPYEALWEASHVLKRPLVFLAGANRVLTEEESEARQGAFISLPAQIAHQATSWFSVRRSLTAIVFSGAFERYPGFRVGVVGFGAGWAPFAIVRGNEMQQVRPERTGPPTRVPPSVADEETIRQTIHLREVADVAIDASRRSGTVGMAPEGVGFYFQEGDSFGDHFKRGVFLTFNLKGRLSMMARPYLGAQALLWGHRYPAPATEDLPSVQARLGQALGWLGDQDRDRLVAENTAALFGL
jgi:predicted TIM-barrel fold metal-dependent hydrolase